MLSAPLLLALGTDAQRARLLPRLASGALTAALAAPGPALATALALTGGNGGGWAGGGRAGGVQARRADGGWRLYGQADQVLDGHSAGLLIVPAHTGGFARSRTLLFLVPGDATGPWEHDAHLYLKRAKGDELLFGPVHRLRAHAADRARLFETTEIFEAIGSEEAG
ncbi:hypothetical protein GCM10009535_16470 [Streptomyces thermocarboxydovorans]|uniref:Uncharacterized protein n=1 Tax=Streptomyces thermocarboxydovorans TaxID=59298 RepID=A0ABP3SLH6_9ACTN